MHFLLAFQRGMKQSEKCRLLLLYRTITWLHSSHSACDHNFYYQSVLLHNINFATMYLKQKFVLLISQGCVFATLLNKFHVVMNFSVPITHEAINNCVVSQWKSLSTINNQTKLRIEAVIQGTVYSLTINLTLALILSYSMIVLYSRDHQGLGMAHEKISPKN